MLLYLAAIGVALLVAPDARAQPALESGSLAGRVVNYRNGNPVSGGFVSARRLATDSAAARLLAVRIDSAGRFQFPVLRPGSYFLRVLGSGMLGGHHIVYVPAGSATVQEIVATPPRFDPAERDRQREALAEHAEKWGEAALRRYAFAVRMRCFCPSPPEPWMIAVEGDSTRGLNATAGGGPPLHLASIPALFDWVTRLLDDPSQVVEIRYHARLGYPEYVRTDIDPYVTDSWYEIRIDRLQRIR